MTSWKEFFGGNIPNFWKSYPENIPSSNGWYICLYITNAGKLVYKYAKYRNGCWTSGNGRKITVEFFRYGGDPEC